MRAACPRSPRATTFRCGSRSARSRGRRALRRHRADLRLRQPRRVPHRRPRDPAVSRAARCARARAVRGRATAQHRLGVLTDIGVSTPFVEASLTGCSALVLECNHDLDLLATSDYPPSLKHRIAGRFGHLHNEAAAALLAALDTSRLQHIIAAHLSQQNNTPAKARAALAGALRCAEDWIGIADQADGLRLARDVLTGDTMEKRQELYSGKAKTVYATDDPHLSRDALSRRRVRVRRRQARQARPEGRDQQQDQRVRDGQARRRPASPRTSCAC